MNPKDLREEFKEPLFNNLWQNLWDFANANGTITLTAQQARELYSHISRDVTTGLNALLTEISEEVEKAEKFAKWADLPENKILRIENKSFNEGLQKAQNIINKRKV